MLFLTSIGVKQYSSDPQITTFPSVAKMGKVFTTSLETLISL